MLTIRIVNTGEGTNEKAAYKYAVHVNGEEIARGDFEGHNRNDGWASLVKSIAECHLTQRAADECLCMHLPQDNGTVTIHVNPWCSKHGIRR